MSRPQNHCATRILKFDIYITDIHGTRYVYFSEHYFVEKNIKHQAYQIGFWCAVCSRNKATSNPENILEYVDQIIGIFQLKCESKP